MEQGIIEDVAFLRYWFYENQSIFIMPYIESHFAEESWMYQFRFMEQHLFFTKKIIEDDLMSNDDKVHKILDSLSYGKSKIVLIKGARGSGKTATACWLADELYKRGKHGRIYYVKKGERPPFPDFIKVVDEVEDVPNNSIAIIDESAIKYNARNSWSDENKDFTSRLVILRHKGVSVLVITQHAKMVEINVRRLADIIIYKQGADIYNEDENKDDDRVLVRRRLTPKQVDEVLVEIPTRAIFYKFKHALPDWWSDYISKSFKDFNPEVITKLNRAQRIAYEKEKSETEHKRKVELEVAKIKAMGEAGIKVKKKLIPDVP